MYEQVLIIHTSHGIFKHVRIERSREAHCTSPPQTIRWSTNENPRRVDYISVGHPHSTKSDASSESLKPKCNSDANKSSVGFHLVSLAIQQLGNQNSRLGIEFHVQRSSQNFHEGCGMYVQFGQVVVPTFGGRFGSYSVRG